MVLGIWCLRRGPGHGLQARKRPLDAYGPNNMLTGKVEVQVGILNPWRYAGIIVAFVMTHNRHEAHE